MKRFIIITFLFLLTGTTLKAQDVLKTDSLKNVLATEATDTITLKKYLVLAVSRLQTNNAAAKFLILDWIIGRQ